MPRLDWLILIGLGALLVLLGIGLTIWGKAEERRYYDAISHRPDAREFVEHRPRIAEPGALRTGGRIAFTLGLLMLAMGGALWLWPLRLG